MTAPVYLLSGEEFLTADALDRIRNETGSDPLSEIDFEAPLSAPDLIEALQTPSLLGGIRLVVVRNAEGLLKAEVDALTGYLDAPSPEAVLVLIAAGRTKLDAAVKRYGEIISLDPPKGRRLAAWIRRQGRERGLRIDDRGAWALIDAVGGELRDLDGALSRLTTSLGAGGVVSQETVRTAFPRAAEQRIYVFTDAVGDRRMPVAMGNLRRLLGQGEEPLVIFGALAGQVRRMLRARRIADSGARTVGDALALPSWRAERLSKQARMYREDELVAAMQTLAETDLELKGGDLPPEAALERAVIRILSRS